MCPIKTDHNRWANIVSEHYQIKYPILTVLICLTEDTLCFERAELLLSSFASTERTTLSLDDCLSRLPLMFNQAPFSFVACGRRILVMFWTITGKNLKFVDFFVCCTADWQAEEDRNQLNNNQKIVELETSASDWLWMIFVAVLTLTQSTSTV